MKTTRRALRAVTASLGVALLSGCYSFIPVDRPAPGSTVRVHVPLTSAVQSPNAPRESLAVEGVVLSDGDSLVIETRNRREFGAFREVMELDTLRVARSGVSALELQVFSKPKTFGATALLVAGTVGIIAGLANAATGSKGEGSPGPGVPAPQIRVKPIFLGLFGAIFR